MSKKLEKAIKEANKELKQQDHFQNRREFQEWV